MKYIVIALQIIFLILIFGSNALSFTNTKLINERMESYEACIRLRNKAPSLKLNCENLKENISSEKAIIKETHYAGIKLLSSMEAETRKVNKSQENKLRNLIRKLANESRLRKD